MGVKHTVYYLVLSSNFLIYKWKQNRLGYRDIYTNVYFFICVTWSFTNHQALQKCPGATEVIGKAEQTVMDDQYQWWRSAKAGDHGSSVSRPDLTLSLLG